MVSPAGRKLKLRLRQRWQTVAEEVMLFGAAASLVPVSLGWDRLGHESFASAISADFAPAGRGAFSGDIKLATGGAAIDVLVFAADPVMVPSAVLCWN